MLKPRNVGLDDSRNEYLNNAQNAVASGNKAMIVGTMHGEPGLRCARSNDDLYAGRTGARHGRLPRAQEPLLAGGKFPLSVDVGSAFAAEGFAGGAPLLATSTGTGSQEVTATFNLLASARIAVYPTSVFGLATGSSSVAVSGPGDPRGGPILLANLKSEMEDLARATGGEAIFGTNDIAGAMERTYDDGNTYYTLAYKPSNNEWNGKFRTIKVEAPRCGSLIYRRGYYATPDRAAADSGDDLRRAMQLGVPEETSLRLRAKLLPNDPQHPGLLVESTITTEDLSFTTTPDGHRHARIFVQLVAFNDGKQQPKNLPQTAGTLNIDLDPARYEFIRSAGIAFRQRLALKPGKYRVILGVNDESSQKLGTVQCRLSYGPKEKARLSC